MGELIVDGVEIPSRKALIANAGFISRLARMENELKGMTERSSRYSRSIAGRLRLNRGNRNHLEMDDLLQQLARTATELVSCEAAFILLKEDASSIKIEHYPEVRLDDELINSCLAKVAQTGNELLLNLSETEYSRARLEIYLLHPLLFAMK